MTPLSSRSAPMRLASLVTAINVLVAAGFSFAGLVSPKSILPSGYALTEASFIFAMYAAARTIPLAFMALIAIYKQSQSALLTFGYTGGLHPIAGCRRWVAAARSGEIDRASRHCRIPIFRGVPVKPLRAEQRGIATNSQCALSCQRCSNHERFSE